MVSEWFPAHVSEFLSGIKQTIIKDETQTVENTNMNPFIPNQTEATVPDWLLKHQRYGIISIVLRGLVLLGCVLIMIAKTTKKDDL